MKLDGLYTALVTPMANDGKLDEKALRRLVDFQVEGGVQGLVPVGTTGESPTLDGEECKRVIQVVVEQARGRVPVIAGAGSNSTAEAILDHAVTMGVDCVIMGVSKRSALWRAMKHRALELQANFCCSLTCINNCCLDRICKGTEQRCCSQHGCCNCNALSDRLSCVTNSIK